VSREYPRPILQPSAKFDWIIGSADPAITHRLAQETAWALLDRVRSVADPAIVARVVAIADPNGVHEGAGADEDAPGIDDIAELWSDSGAHSLAGVLWRLYLLRRIAAGDPDGTAELYRLGAERATRTIDPIVAGLDAPASPDAVVGLCDTILRGVFAGDFAAALDRAASTCKLLSLGSAALADERDLHDDGHAGELTTRALRYDEFHRDLRAWAKRFAAGTLA
jgi:hypothetical protein